MSRNFQGWDERKLRELQQTGRIKNFQAKENPHKQNGGRKVVKHFPKKSKAKEYVAWNLWYFANQNALVLEEEYRFAQPERNFRFDWAFPSLKIAIEYEGGLLDHRSGHRSVKGVNKDVTKYNLAQQKGWKVLRITAENYTTLIPELNKLIT